MSILVQKEGHFVIGRYETDSRTLYDWPVPPGFEVTGQLTFTTRLHSTGNGRAAWWKSAGTQVVQAALNRAPYRPVLRAVVTSFTWWPPRWEDKDRLLQSAESLENFILQGGNDVLNWRASVIEPLPDPAHDALQQWAQYTRADGWEPDAIQGNLRVYSWGTATPRAPCHPENTISRTTKFYRLFNHTMCGWVSIAGPRVFDVDGVPTAVALVCPARGDILVLSPDHPFKPVCLLREVMYILAHPLPLHSVD